jgi:hypothetical protein
MNDLDLDRSYTALCNALGKVGQEKSELLLAMVALGLMSRSDNVQAVLELVERARDRCLAD